MKDYQEVSRFRSLYKKLVNESQLYISNRIFYTKLLKKIFRISKKNSQTSAHLKSYIVQHKFLRYVEFKQGIVVDYSNLEAELNIQSSHSRLNEKYNILLYNILNFVVIYP